MNAKAIFLISAVASGLSLAACSKPFNDERAVGGVSSNTYTPRTISQPMLAPQTPGEQYPQAQPSVLSINRDNWDEVVIAVPNNLPIHEATYKRDVIDNVQADRTKGRYPSTDTVNQTTNLQAQRNQAREALMAPIFAAGDLILLPVRMAYDRPWFVGRQGVQGGKYDRANRPAVYLPPEPIGEAYFPMAKSAFGQHAPAPTLPTSIESSEPSAGISPIQPITPKARHTTEAQTRPTPPTSPRAQTRGSSPTVGVVRRTKDGAEHSAAPTPKSDSNQTASKPSPVPPSDPKQTSSPSNAGPSNSAKDSSANQAPPTQPKQQASDEKSKSSGEPIEHPATHTGSADSLGEGVNKPRE